MTDVDVNFAHEEDLIEYHPQQVSHLDLMEILRDLDHTVRNGQRVRTIEEEGAEAAMSTAPCCSLRPLASSCCWP